MSFPYCSLLTANLPFLSLSFISFPPSSLHFICSFFLPYPFPFLFLPLSLSILYSHSPLHLLPLTFLSAFPFPSLFFFPSQSTPPTNIQDELYISFSLFSLYPPFLFIGIEEERKLIPLFSYKQSI